MCLHTHPGLNFHISYSKVMGIMGILIKNPTRARIKHMGECFQRLIGQQGTHALSKKGKTNSIKLLQYHTLALRLPLTL